MIAQVLVPLANGFEEIEATCPIDLLRRAQVEVVTASCESEPEVCGRSGIIIKADQQLADVRPENSKLSFTSFVECMSLNSDSSASFLLHSSSRSALISFE